jgi:hypothetical protein
MTNPPTLAQQIEKVREALTKAETASAKIELWTRNKGYEDCMNMAFFAKSEIRRAAESLSAIEAQLAEPKLTPESGVLEIMNAFAKWAMKQPTEKIVALMAKPLAGGKDDLIEFQYGKNGQLYPIGRVAKPLAGGEMRTAEEWVADYGANMGRYNGRWENIIKAAQQDAVSSTAEALKLAREALELARIAIGNGCSRDSIYEKGRLETIKAGDAVEEALAALKGVGG